VSELKPCPFCGGEASTEFIDYEGDTWVGKHEVICCNDTCVVQPNTDGFEPEEDAIKAWNTRALEVKGE
jgi:Lar family restriction alleviation protein